jgi:hypothetical protein
MSDNLEIEESHGSGTKHHQPHTTHEVNDEPLIAPARDDDGVFTFKNDKSHKHYAAYFVNKRSLGYLDSQYDEHLCTISSECETQESLHSFISTLKSFKPHISFGLNSKIPPGEWRVYDTLSKFGDEEGVFKELKDLFREIFKKYASGEVQYCAGEWACVATLVTKSDVFDEWVYRFRQTDPDDPSGDDEDDEDDEDDSPMEQ